MKNWLFGLRGEEMDGLVDSRREGTGEAAERGEAPPDAILFCGYEFEKCGVMMMLLFVKWELKEYLAY